MVVKTTPEGQIYTHRLSENLDVTLPNELSGFASLAFLFGPNGEKLISRMEMDEAEKLFQECKRSSGLMLDIGTRHGASALIMAAANHSAQVISIDISPDIHPSIEDCITKFNLGERVSFEVKSSRDPIPESRFSLICFDGDHTAFGLSQDILTHWNAIVIEDGQAVFHDVSLECIVHNRNLELEKTNVYQQHITPIVMFLIDNKIADFAGGIGDLVILNKRADLTTSAKAKMQLLVQSLDPRPKEDV